MHSECINAKEIDIMSRKFTLVKNLLIICSAIFMLSILSLSISADTTSWREDNYTFELYGGGVQIVTYHGSDNSPFIPSITKKGYTVVKIGNSAFRSRSLSEITIPSTIQIIGEYAFENCSKLKSITFPDSVVEIQKYAFHDCKNMISATLPSNLKILGDYSFANTHI